MADVVRKKLQGGHWRVWTGLEYNYLEDMPVHVRATAYNYLSGENLRDELKLTTERSKHHAAAGNYEEARRYAVVADELEVLLANGGDKHG